MTKPSFTHRLDERDDGAEIQQYLLEKTGQKTVPNVFISTYHRFTPVLPGTQLTHDYLDQQHVGGSDAVAALHRDGKLAGLVAA